ncbi:MAG: hypothetical protein COW56_05645 [Rhodocyclales bacterium CG17_big_fil_post_rev_8_21_14_2_50_68_7]|nr:MAG: hypothetical protein COW56_05645 [Rhodocyclales bacterium CG17_big_fil_post_rev_8_21_14_2_50_68_7]PIX76438.1 MAG: hypothetical protein COZ38_00340 [Rhodocyclales bacterium CG_4_10_14_3_um_filter_68_10]PJA56118.1 MAG: hypothetical protein CO164_14580 [Rhodocyclales bacterium CG_4_9_14_3_um_filter_68_10]
MSLVGQVVLYAAFAAFIGYFASHPKYRHLAPDRAMVKLSMSHFGARECRTRSAAELARLPPNMRAPLECKRERSPLRIEVELDGQTVYRDSIRPTGIARDGVAAVYRRFEVGAGTHRLAVRLNDDARVSGFTHMHEGAVELKPAQILVIDFNPDHGGLFFR